MKTIRVFKNGGSQAVRIPKAFEFDCDEVFINHDAKTGKITLMPKKTFWNDFIARIQNTPNAFPDDLLGVLANEKQAAHTRKTQEKAEVFADWSEDELTGKGGQT